MRLAILYREVQRLGQEAKNAATAYNAAKKSLDRLILLQVLHEENPEPQQPIKPTIRKKSKKRKK